MQRFFLLTILLLGLNLTLWGQEWKDRLSLPDYFPVPTQTNKSLFFIQRNKNVRTIVYDLNLREDGTLDRKNPIEFYWLEGDGERKELSWLESWLAYGYKAKKKAENLFHIKLRAHDSRYIILKEENEKWRVIMPINGEESYLTNIYAYADESGIFPDVKHVDIFGVDIKTGRKVKERIFD